MSLTPQGGGIIVALAWAVYGQSGFVQQFRAVLQTSPHP
jgi:hypothetical protein